MHISKCLRNLAKLSTTTIPTVKVPPNAKVTVCGSSYLAQTILLDLKLSPLLEEIRIYDERAKARQLAEDLNQIATNSVVLPFYGSYQIRCAFQDVDVIVLAGGEYGEPGESKHCLFKKNLPVLLDMAYECAHHNPDAAVVVLTPPGSRNVPMISELYEKVGIPDSGKIMSPMFQYEMIATRVVADHLKLPSSVVSLPVVGGCCSDTVIPVFSQASPQNEFSEREMNSLLQAIRQAPEDVAALKRGKPPSLCPAMAASRLVLDIVKGRFNMPQTPQSVFLRSDVLLNVKYLGTPVEFGPRGVNKNSAMPQLSDPEFKLLAETVVRLQEDARIGAAAADAKWNEIY